MSILKSTNRVSAYSIVGAHIGPANSEVEVARSGTAKRTAPIVAAGTDKLSEEFGSYSIESPAWKKPP